MNAAPAPFEWPKARIEICGPMGAGKTTLLRLLAHYGARPIFEPVETHPYLSDFYDNPARYALEKCCFFTLDYLHSLKRESERPDTLVLDASVPLLRAYHDIAPLSQTDRLIADDLLDGIAATLPTADLYIHLTASTQYLLSRIAKRGRDMESAVSAHYLTLLNNRLDYHIGRIASHSRLLVLEVASLEGLTSPESILPVIEQINKSLLNAIEAAGARKQQTAFSL